MSAKIPAEKEKDNKSEKKRVLHRFEIKKVQFTVDAKYKPVRALGSGAYGTVCSAKDTEINRDVAIKKITNAFADHTDCKRIIREMKILHFLDCENIVKLYDIIPPPPPKIGPFEDIYLVQELMETDLDKIINSSNALSEEHVQFFVYQMLCGLLYIHSADIVHRDIKPQNLLVNGDCKLKLCDFGLARWIDPASEEGGDDGKSGPKTEYVVTRWYRAPEIILSIGDYDTKVDIWAAGCIAAELFLRKPLFPGSSHQKQLELILQVLGTPKEEQLRFIKNEEAATFVRSLRPRSPVALGRIIQNASTVAIDLLTKMLSFDPHTRPTARECLEHEYFDNLRKPEDLVTAPAGFSYDVPDVETKTELQDFVWREIDSFRPGASDSFFGRAPAAPKAASS